MRRITLGLLVSLPLLGSCSKAPETKEKLNPSVGQAGALEKPVATHSEAEDEDEEIQEYADPYANPDGSSDSETSQGFVNGPDAELMESAPLPDKQLLATPLLPAFCKDVKTEGDWKSSKAFFNASGKLEYPADREKNRIVDYSFAGYRYGSVEPPKYPVVATIGPIEGDNTKNIQDALDRLGKSPPDAKGVRGALLLKPGRYPVSGSLKIPYSGVVLRGSGRGSDPTKNSIIFATGNTPRGRTVIILGIGPAAQWKAIGTPVDVVDAFVPVGSQSLSVKNAYAFKAGDFVQIKHRSTQAWINAVDGGGTVREPNWEEDSTDIIFNRQVVSVDGNTLQLDAPIYNQLNKKLAAAVVSKAGIARNIVRESGVENLAVEIQNKGGKDENHAADAIGVHGAQDSWVRNITAKHFQQAGVYTQFATRITIDRANTLQPVGIRTGGRFYNFNVSNFSQLILFKNCAAKDGRHNFISNGKQTTSGIVWHKCTSDGESTSEGHRRWTTGMLFDTINELGKGRLHLINRGDAGTSHGWGSAHSVVWNYSGTSTVQKAPTAQNYLISPVGKQGPTTIHGPGEVGHVEIKKGRLSPASLYEAQLCERLQN